MSHKHGNNTFISLYSQTCFFFFLAVTVVVVVGLIVVVATFFRFFFAVVVLGLTVEVFEENKFLAALTPFLIQLLRLRIPCLPFWYDDVTASDDEIAKTQIIAIARNALKTRLNLMLHQNHLVNRGQLIKIWVRNTFLYFILYSQGYMRVLPVYRNFIDVHY